MAAELAMERFCKSHPGIPTGFRPKALGCKSASCNSGDHPKRITNRNAVAAILLFENFALTLGLNNAATPLVLFQFVARTQGSSPTRNPGLDAAIPLGLLAGLKRIENRMASTTTHAATSNEARLLLQIASFHTHNSAICSFTRTCPGCSRCKFLTINGAFGHAGSA